MVLVVRANRVLFIEISTTLRSVTISAELRHGDVRSSKVCSAKLAWSSQEIVLLVIDSQSTPLRPSSDCREMKTKMNEMNATSKDIGLLLLFKYFVFIYK